MNIYIPVVSYFFMLPELNELKLKRIAQNLTQTDLSMLAGISQSEITKIENGKIIPSYSKGKKLFDVLEELNLKEQVKAKDLINKKVFFVSPNDSVRKAISLMKNNGISQIPVLEKGLSVGRLSETLILSKAKNPKIDLNSLKVKEIMDEALPTIQESTPLTLILQLLEYNSALLVSKKGQIKGIITKADLFDEMLKKHWI